MTTAKKSVGLFKYNVLTMVPSVFKITYFWLIENQTPYVSYVIFWLYIKHKSLKSSSFQEINIFWDVLLLPTGQIIAKYVFVIKKICQPKVGQRQAARTPHCFLALNFRGHRHSSPL